jgi:hypothetical protein
MDKAVGLIPSNAKEKQEGFEITAQTCPLTGILFIAIMNLIFVVGFDSPKLSPFILPCIC